MKKQLLLRTIPCVIALLFVTACASTWNMEKWSKLEDRTFYLTEASFTFEGFGSSALESTVIRHTESCREMYDSLDVPAIAKALEKKYNIKVDISEYQNDKTAGITKSPKFKIIRTDKITFHQMGWVSTRENVTNKLKIDYYLTHNIVNNMFAYGYSVDLVHGEEAAAQVYDSSTLWGGGFTMDAKFATMVKNVKEMAGWVEKELNN